MTFPSLHNVWTEARNFSLSNFSRSLTSTTQDRQRLKTLEIIDNEKFLFELFHNYHIFFLFQKEAQHLST